MTEKRQLVSTTMPIAPSIPVGEAQGMQNWAQEIATVVNELVKQVAANGAIFVWDRGCLAVPTNVSDPNTDAAVIAFESEYVGQVIIMVTMVQSTGPVELSLNGQSMGTLQNEEPTVKAIFERSAANLEAGLNALRFWSTGNNGAEILRVEVWRNTVNEFIPVPVPLSIDPDTGIVVIDARLSELFSLALTRDVTAIQFINVATERILIIEITQRGQPANTVWNFNAVTEGWSFAGGDVVVSPLWVTLTATDNDPTLTSPPNLAIPGETDFIIRARVRRTAGVGWNGQAFYATADHGFDELFSNTVVADPTVTDEWVIVQWNMSNLLFGGDDWTTSVITQIRLDLGSQVGDAFDIDFVSVGTPDQIGLFTIDWPTTVTFESGVPFVPTQVFDKTDAIGLSTINGGASWLLRGANNVSLVEGGTEPDSGNNPPPPSPEEPPPPPAPTLAAAISPSPAFGFCFVSLPGACSPSVQVVVDIVGGTPPYSAKWIQISGSAAVVPNSTTIVNPTFSAASGSSNVTHKARWRCTVVDAAAAVVQPEADITLERANDA